LYDLENDPDALRNLIAEPNDQWSPRAGAMAKQLWHWMKDVDDAQLERFQTQVQPPLD
jgi:hypothetical protein